MNFLTARPNLAQRVNEEHRAAEAAAFKAIEHVRNAGALLIEAKAALGHGEFLPWLKQNSEVTPRQAQKYMRIANNWEQIANTNRGSYLSIREALRVLAPPAGADVIDPDAITLSQIEAVKADIMAAVHRKFEAAEKVEDGTDQAVAFMELLRFIEAAEESFGMPRNPASHVGPLGNPRGKYLNTDQDLNDFVRQVYSEALSS